MLLFITFIKRKKIAVEIEGQIARVKRPSKIHVQVFLTCNIIVPNVLIICIFPVQNTVYPIKKAMQMRT